MKGRSVTVCVLVGLLSLFQASMAQEFEVFYKTTNNECAPVPLDECVVCDYDSFKCTSGVSIECIRYDDDVCGRYPQNAYVARVDCNVLLLEYSTCAIGYVQESDFVLEVTSTSGAVAVTTGFTRDKKAEWTQSTTTATATGDIDELTFLGGGSTLRLLSINGGTSFTTSAGDCAVNATCVAGDLNYKGYWVPYTGNATVAQPFGNYLMSWGFHSAPVTVETTTEVYFRADDNNVYLSMDFLAEVSLAVASPAPYSVLSLALTNLYSNTPFLHYDVELDGVTTNGLVTVCGMEEEALFGATAISCRFPLLR